MISIRLRVIALVCLFVMLALASIGAGIVLQESGTQMSGELYRHEVQQSRLVEGISRRITLIDADIAAVALGYKPPLDAHEYIRRNRPQIEQMMVQLRGQLHTVQGERRDMLDAIDHNLPDFYLLLEEVNQAYLAADIAGVGELFRQRWPIMRYAILGPLDRLLYLQQNELDEVLVRQNGEGRQVRKFALLILLVCLCVAVLLGWRTWRLVCSDTQQQAQAMRQILNGHAPETAQIHNPELAELLDSLWHDCKALKMLCLERETWQIRQKVLLDATCDGLCCFDRNGRLLYANSVACRQLPESDTAFSLATHWPELLRIARSEGWATQENEILCDASGQTRTVSLTLRQIPGGEADAAFMLHLADQSETVRKQAELLQAYHSIRQLNEEIASLRNEIATTRELAFLGRLTSVMVTPLLTHIGQAEATLDQFDANLHDGSELQKMRSVLLEIRKLAQDLRSSATHPGIVPLPKIQAGGLE